MRRETLICSDCTQYVVALFTLHLACPVRKRDEIEADGGKLLGGMHVGKLG